jgi:hypothetical protein
MAIQPEKLKMRAIKAGIRASKRRHHVVSKEELLGLKIQVLPATLRGFLIIAGVAMIALAVIGWPFPADPHQVLMGIGGGVLLIFGIFGIRRTLENVVDSAVGEGIGALLEGILSGIGSAVDL